MAFFERLLGLRVAAVAFVASLPVLGVQAPASATSPTISSFSPTSGPAGCVVVITGTNFKDPIVTSVDIGGTPVSAFKVVSGKEIWATVAGDASGTIPCRQREVCLEAAPGRLGVQLGELAASRYTCGGIGSP
jgi:IPT/TIG domain